MIDWKKIFPVSVSGHPLLLFLIGLGIKSNDFNVLIFWELLEIIEVYVTV